MEKEGWSVVFASGTDYEAELVRSRLEDADIPAVVLSQRDHAWNLNHGHLAKVRVLVQKELKEAAAELLGAPPVTDAELERIALGQSAKQP